MILQTLAGLSLVVTVSVDDQAHSRKTYTGLESPARVLAQQSNTAVRPLVRSATRCIAQIISANPRKRREIKRGNFDHLTQWVVDSIPYCAVIMREMIDTHDRVYGAGTGEAFFSGPYLDLLPSVVETLIADTIEQ
jgi:hypothetical protein